jgi:hypothetical protein
LKSLDVAFCSDMLKMDNLCTLLQSNEVLKSLTVCSRFAESPVGRGYTFLQVMLVHNSTLERLVIAHLYGLGSELTQLAGGLGSIRELVLAEISPSTPGEVRYLSGILHESPPARSSELHPSKLMVDWIVIFLQALKTNNTLRLLDLSGCSAVKEQQHVYDAILNCLETKPWLHLNLHDTPLSKSASRFPTIQQKLQQNATFREAFGNWNPQLVNYSYGRGNWNPQLVNSTGARVFLCGSPRAGKCRSHLP